LEGPGRAEGYPSWRPRKLSASWKPEAFEGSDIEVDSGAADAETASTVSSTECQSLRMKPYDARHASSALSWIPILTLTVTFGGCGAIDAFSRKVATLKGPLARCVGCQLSSVGAWVCGTQSGPFLSSSLDLFLFPF
jgi:hypothetical protein